MKKKKENRVKGLYKESWKFLAESKNYIFVAIAIFFLLAIIGYIFPIFFKEQIINFMKELSSKVDLMGIKEVIPFIILNNVKASFFAVIFGIFLGIFPVITAVANGYLLGFAARMSVNQQGISVLWRLLPHGIFELPAVLISIGLGLRLGVDFVRNIKGFWKNVAKALKLFLLIIIPLLIIAGIIEGILIVFLR